MIGNNAVHPGTLDLRDDSATAEKLFGLVNLIAEIMISQPKRVAEMYDSLPWCVAGHRAANRLAPLSLITGCFRRLPFFWLISALTGRLRHFNNLIDRLQQGNCFEPACG